MLVGLIIYSLNLPLIYCGKEYDKQCALRPKITRRDHLLNTVLYHAFDIILFAAYQKVLAVFPVVFLLHGQ